MFRVIAPDERNWSTCKRAGEETLVTVTAVAPAASFGQPVGDGAGVLPILAVTALALSEPALFVAVTRARIVRPTSPERTPYVVDVAPPMSLHEPPPASQSRHW